MQRYIEGILIQTAGHLNNQINTTITNYPVAVNVTNILILIYSQQSVFPLPHFI